MHALHFRCVNCGQEYPLGLRYHCENCRFPLEIIYSSPEAGQPIEVAGNQGIWGYQDWLPTVSVSCQVSLGEGHTPLVAARRLGAELGLPNLYIKNEGQNPTGSFKDRPTSAGVSIALTLGLDTVAVSSTGNAGAALAAYAARAGLQALVFVADRTPPAKLVQMVMHGARIVPVHGSISDAFWLAYNASVAWKWMNLTSTYLCPYTVEGDKTVAYELYQQLGSAPDWILVPVSVGPLLAGILKGFEELYNLGWVNKIPRMVAVQASNCSPIVEAFEENAEYVRPWQKSFQTVAGGIADPLIGYERDGTHTLRLVRKSGGLAVKAPDSEILAATHQLARLEGVFAEPTGAVSVAALSQLKQHPGFSQGDCVVCLVTGSGLKQLRTFEAEIALPEAVKPTLEALSERLENSIPR